MDKQLKFQRGDRVKLSEEWWSQASSHALHNWRGKTRDSAATVQGYRKHGAMKGAVNVVWDGYKTVSAYHPKFLELIR